MCEPVQPSPCPFVVRLVAMLLESPSAAPHRRGPWMYTRLIDLEAEARRDGASDATRQLIARVRRISGTATVIPFPRRPEFGDRPDGTLR